MERGGLGGRFGPSRHLPSRGHERAKPSGGVEGEHAGAAGPSGPALPLPPAHRAGDERVWPRGQVDPHHLREGVPVGKAGSREALADVHVTGFPGRGTQGGGVGAGGPPPGTVHPLTSVAGRTPVSREAVRAVARASADPVPWTGEPARMIHESFCCNRRLHAISGRARASGLDVPSRTPVPLVAAVAPICRTLDGFATNAHESCGLGPLVYPRVKPTAPEDDTSPVGSAGESAEGGRVSVAAGPTADVERVGLGAMRRKEWKDGS